MRLLENGPCRSTNALPQFRSQLQNERQFINNIYQKSYSS
jgi:hypothetical protein